MSKQSIFPVTCGPCWTPAAFFEWDADRLRCTLCPHGCLPADGQEGICRVRRRRGTQMETSTFAVAVAHVTPIERKPLYHFRPGSSTLTLAAPGCTFGCRYCQNHRLSQFGRGSDLPWTATLAEPDRIIEQAVHYQAAIAFSYSEPVLAAELTLALAPRAQARGVSLVWKTNGFITPAALRLIAPCLTAVNLDLKAADDRRHRALTGAPLAPVLAALDILAGLGVWIEISTPLIAGFNDDDASLAQIAGIIRRLGRHIPWHLVRVVPEFRLRDLVPTPPATLQRAYDIGRGAGLNFLYVERALGPAARHTYCPSCGHPVIRRAVWGLQQMDLVTGCCPQCGTAIPGRW